jgi:hypothetical protein
MNYQDFKEALLAALEKAAEGTGTISVKEVTKPNDTILTGVLFKTEEGDEKNSVCPTVYIEEMFDYYLHGTSIDEIVNKCMDLFLNRALGPDIPDAFASPAEHLDGLTVQVIDITRNMSFLENVPYRCIGNGYGLIARLMAVTETGSYITTVNNGLMADIGLTKDELFDRAVSNAKDHVYVQKLSEAVGLSDDGSNTYVVTNDEKHLGAASIFLPGIAEMMVSKLNDSFYVLPSSIHETIIMPEKEVVKNHGPFGVQTLQEMVVQANSDSGIVEPKEVLSDTVLYYNAETNRFEIPEALRNERRNSDADRCVC